MYLVAVAVAVSFFLQEPLPVPCLNSGIASVEYCLCVGAGPRRLCPSRSDFYLVINNYGQSGAAFAETDLGEADLETTINDLMSGQ
jgi:hypothetical protein